MFKRLLTAAMNIAVGKKIIDDAQSDIRRLKTLRKERRDIENQRQGLKEELKVLASLIEKFFSKKVAAKPITETLESEHYGFKVPSAELRKEILQHLRKIDDSEKEEFLRILGNSDFLSKLSKLDNSYIIAKLEEDTISSFGRYIKTLQERHDRFRTEFDEKLKKEELDPQNYSLPLLEPTLWSKIGYLFLANRSLAKNADTLRSGKESLEDGKQYLARSKRSLAKDIRVLREDFKRLKKKARERTEVSHYGGDGGGGGGGDEGGVVIVTLENQSALLSDEITQQAINTQIMSDIQGANQFFGM